MSEEVQAIADLMPHSEWCCGDGEGPVDEHCASGCAIVMDQAAQAAWDSPPVRALREQVAEQAERIRELETENEGLRINVEALQPEALSDADQSWEHYINSKLDKLAEAEAAIQRVRATIGHERHVAQPGLFSEVYVSAVLDTLKHIEQALDGE